MMLRLRTALVQQRQRRLKPSQQTNIFVAYLKNDLGAKYFVMALWQTVVQKGGATEHTTKPLWQLSRNEWWWLNELWSGALVAELRRAEGKCFKVQAKNFVLDEDI